MTWSTLWAVLAETDQGSKEFDDIDCTVLLWVSDNHIKYNRPH